MDLFGSVLFPILIFIILHGPLMFVHELGHFIAAKRAGIRVEEFGMGFPPRALTLFKRGETTYTLNWLPMSSVRPILLAATWARTTPASEHSSVRASAL